MIIIIITTGFLPWLTQVYLLTKNVLCLVLIAMPVITFDTFQTKPLPAPGFGLADRNTDSIDSYTGIGIRSIIAQ